MITILLLLAMLLYLGLLSDGLTILALSVMFGIVAYKWRNVHRLAPYWYVVALLLGTAAVIWNDSPYLAYVYRGFLGYGLMLVVMFVGILPNRWTLARNIKKNRGVYSILSFLLISPHAALHVFGVLDGINLFGIVAYVLMVPLTVISFQLVRREMDPRDWRNVQKAAYIIYLSLFVHVIWVGDWFDKIVYAVLATLYVNNKLMKELRHEVD